MKYLAIDFGEKRVGIAVSDKSGLMAFARTTIQKKTKQAFWDEVLALVTKEEAEAIVVGMPRTRDGAKTLIMRQIDNFMASFKRRSELPIYIMEETLSSFDAESRMGKACNAKSGLDGAAAAVILESFLALPPEKRILA